MWHWWSVVAVAIVTLVVVMVVHVVGCGHSGHTHDSGGCHHGHPLAVWGDCHCCDRGSYGLMQLLSTSHCGIKVGMAVWLGSTLAVVRVFIGPHWCCQIGRASCRERVLVAV